MNDAINPEHPVTRAMSQNWRAVVAVLIRKFTDSNKVVLTKEDLKLIQDNPVIAIKENTSGLNLILVTQEQALAMAQMQENKRNGIKPNS